MYCILLKESGSMSIRISTLLKFLTVGLLIVALAFAVLGFAKAGDSQIAPIVISGYMVVSAVLFAVLGIRGTRQKELWQRLLGVGAITAAVYMVGMAIAFYIMLSRVQMPF
jgi:hypothetical protein